MSRLASLLIALASCSRLDLSMEISEKSAHASRVLTSFKLSGAEISKLTRRERHKEGLRRGKRQYRGQVMSEPENDGICKTHKENLNDNELKKFLCDKHFDKIRTYIDRVYRASDLHEARCERNLIILKGTSREIPTRCKMENKGGFITDKNCLSAGSSHCSTTEINRVCGHAANFWERHVPSAKWGEHVVSVQSACEKSIPKELDLADKITARINCCKERMEMNPTVYCKEIELSEHSDYFTTEVEFVYIVKENDAHSGMKKLFTIKIRNHGICAASLF